jgi:hypothetical protein
MAPRIASDARHEAILPTSMNVAFVLAATEGAEGVCSVRSVFQFFSFRYYQSCCFNIALKALFKNIGGHSEVFSQMDFTFNF